MPVAALLVEGKIFSFGLSVPKGERGSPLQNTSFGFVKAISGEVVKKCRQWIWLDLSFYKGNCKGCPYKAPYRFNRNPPQNQLFYKISKMYLSFHLFCYVCLSLKN
jgi:hypothetical protein